MLRLRLLVVTGVALVLVPAAAAGDAELVQARDRFLPAVQRAYGDDPDGTQARYDAGRDLVEAVLAAGTVRVGLRELRASLLAQGRRQIGRAEVLDRPAGSTSAGRLAPLPSAPAGVGPRRHDVALSRRLAAVAARTDGAVGIWVHELSSGRYGHVAADAPFAAASTVKLGSLVAALRASPWPERSAWWYDVRQIGFWSSNLGANRVYERLGYRAVTEALRRLGMTSSTYPGPYRATTAYRPPGPHTRVTTARDLGRALYRLHAGARGDPRALGLLDMSRPQAVAAIRVLASAQPASENAGLLRRWLPGAILAQKNGWLSDQRTTAAIVYRNGRATIVVVEVYRPEIDGVAARRVGRDVLRAIGL